MGELYMKIRIFLLMFFVLVSCMFSAHSAFASHNQQTDKLLAGATEPEGVVFEIISRRADYLDWAIPEVERLSRLLRKKYPQMPVAVVSHSREQFALTMANKAVHKQTHAKVRSLVTEQDIPVHVCGVNAERKGVSAKAFPDYVDVADSGPDQIGLYKQMGYEVIVITGH